MQHYRITSNLALTVKPCRPAFGWFVGKTNRLVLVSLSLCGLGLDFYIARNWDYPAWDDAPEFLEAKPNTATTERRTNDRGNVIRLLPRRSRAAGTGAMPK